MTAAQWARVFRKGAQATRQVPDSLSGDARQVVAAALLAMAEESALIAQDTQ